MYCRAPDLSVILLASPVFPSSAPAAAAPAPGGFRVRGSGVVARMTCPRGVKTPSKLRVCAMILMRVRATVQRGALEALLVNTAHGAPRATGPGECGAPWLA